MTTACYQRPLRYRAIAVVLLLTVLATFGLPFGSAAAPVNVAAPASMEAIHTSYLDLTTNIGDLRKRVTSWQGGDESSLNIAVEKLDRIQVVLGAVAWPAAMSASVDKTRLAVAPMSLALNAKDLPAVEAAAKAFGDASHDVTHAFYGEWLPGTTGGAFTNMAPHAAYLDISANIADLRSRVASWQSGDEGSLNIAKEKVERIHVLIQHMAPFGFFARPLGALDAAIPGVSAALEQANVTAAEDALKPISDASHDLTHDFYSWVNISAGPHDADCIQAAYLDASLNLGDLRTRIGDWVKGDEAGLNIGQEKLERLGAVLNHLAWPSTMSPAVTAITAAAQPVREAFAAKNAAAADAALKALGDAAHDLTHAYYGEWLASARSGAHAAGSSATGMGTMAMPGADPAVAPAGSVQDESQPHAHGNVAPTKAVATAPTNRGPVLAAFAVANLGIVAAAAVFKGRRTGQKKPKATVRVETLPEGASE